MLQQRLHRRFVSLHWFAIFAAAGREAQTDFADPVMLLKRWRKARQLLTARFECIPSQPTRNIFGSLRDLPNTSSGFVLKEFREHPLIRIHLRKQSIQPVCP
jgi:hypothetical protein